MKKTKEETISWLKAALKRQKDFQEEIKKEYANKQLVTTA